LNIYVFPAPPGLARRLTDVREPNSSLSAPGTSRNRSHHSLGGTMIPRIFALLILLSCLTMFGDNTKTEVIQPVASYTFHCKQAEQCESLERRETMMKLLAATIEDEYNHVHDTKKFQEIKKLARQLED